MGWSEGGVGMRRVRCAVGRRGLACFFFFSGVLRRDAVRGALGNVYPEEKIKTHAQLENPKARMIIPRARMRSGTTRNKDKK